MGKEMVLKAAVFVLALTALTVGISPARAEEKLPNPALQRMLDKGWTITFMGHAHDMDGWLMEKKEGDQKAHKYMYTTKDGALLMGFMIAPDGDTVVTEQQVAAMKARQAGDQSASAGGDSGAVEKAEKFYAQTEKASWVSMGAADAPYLYAYINTNCPHCQAFWKDIQGAVKEGRVQVRLLPYGEKEENRDSGAALLSVENPQQAWEAYVGGDVSALAKEKIKDGSLKKLADNFVIVRNWKLKDTPFIIYRKPADGVVTAIAGRPENIMLVLADLMKK